MPDPSNASPRSSVWLVRVLGPVSLLAVAAGVVLDLSFPGRVYGLIALGVGAGLAIFWGIASRVRLLSWVGRRSTRLGANSVVMILVSVAILIMLNVLAVRHSSRLDLSQTNAFTLAPQTVKILDALPHDVKIAGFFQKGGESEMKFNDLLSTYRHYSTKISGEAIDPDTHPAVAKQYGITQYDTIVVQEGSQEARIRTVSEQELTNALIRVGKDTKKRIAVLDGHGEPGADDTGPNGFSQAKAALEHEGYDVAPLLLAQSRAVPTGTNVVIIPDPQKPLLPAETEALKRYLADGGHVFIMLASGEGGGIEALTASWGVKFRGDTIVDPDPVSRLLGGDVSMPIIRNYGQHEIVKDFRLGTAFPLAQSLAFEPGKDTAVDYRPLAMTGPQSWGEMHIVDGKARYDPGQDTKGPMDLAAAISPKSSAVSEAKERWRAVVVGNGSFATNKFFNFLGNGDFFVAAVNWLAEESDAIAIRPKEASSSPLFLTAGQQRLVFWIPVVIVPGLITVFGITVWRRRRRL